MRNVIPTLLVLIAVLLSPPARAATVTTIVENTDDDGPGSLRSAIANANPGDTNTINFAIGGTITLTSGELLIDKNLIISGPGASNLVIQRSTEPSTGDFRIFNVLSGNVIISGLTVSNGRTNFGGGIYNDGSLTLNDCAVTGNFAIESGGGIFNGSTMIISNCVVRGNSAAGATEDGLGGGIWNAGTASAITSTISNNSVTSGVGGGFGGGTRNDGTLTLTSSVINGNSANGGPGNGGGFGGGVNNVGATVYLDHSTVSGNVARGGAGSVGGLGEGGGVANDDGTVYVFYSTVSGNVSSGGAGYGSIGGSAQGGGVANYDSLYVFNSTVSGNVSSGGAGINGLGSPYGGGIFNRWGSLTATHSTITANVVPGDGGGIFNLEGWVGLKNTIVAANTATVDLFNVVEFGDIALDGSTSSYGFNLVGSASGLIFPGPSDQFNITAAALKLGPLQNNGGPTFTHALLCGSAALNAGGNTGAPATDQRGFARIVGGVIDIGAYEGGNTAPSISCPDPAELDYVPPAGAGATVSVNVADADGDPLVVVWIVDGTAYQTNAVAAGGPPTAASVTFTGAFGEGSHSILVRVTDSEQCEATCATTVLVTLPPEAPTPLGCELYPIALHENSLVGVPIGGIINDIYNGIQPGNFGWLTWAGSPSVTTLVSSLTSPGNNGTYFNPSAPNDHTVSVGDWVHGKPGLSNNRQVYAALDALKQIDIIVPVWNQALGTGNNSLYRVAAFARVRLTSYRLPGQNRISARFLGFVSCD